MSNWIAYGKLGPRGSVQNGISGTYNVLVFLGVVGYLRDCNSPADLLGFLRLAYTSLSFLTITSQNQVTYLGIPAAV